MQYTTIGPDNHRISRLAFGAMSLKEETREPGKHAVWRALELGVNVFDTADVYSFGESETVLGEALRESGVAREDVFVASKFGILFKGKHPDYRYKAYDLSPTYLRRSCEASLRRLGLDYIDLYQPHRIDYLTPPSAVAEALERLREEGKIRLAGVSNYTAGEIAALARHIRLDALQAQFSIVHQEPLQAELLATCQQRDMRLLCWSPLKDALLTEREQHEHGDWRKQMLEGRRAQIAAMAREMGVSLPQLALAWLLQLPETVPLLGTRNAAHVEEAVKAADLQIPRDVWYELMVIGRGRRIPDRELPYAYLGPR